ncbi:MAG: cytochrome c oxidase accessory protein CcoG [Acidobacteriota bacterium]|nr:cytochrome c oxidase accessory protein CcoG [Acidobacteriota bacterium]MDH3783743.1 cytochrome c oxidase accessory protein CcoG [Acidobacteriota bacterium]
MSDEQGQRVLSTLNRDGSRRWLRPRVAEGPLLTARRSVAYVLILLFTALPYIRVGGRPSVLLNLADREFIFFGKVLLATDTVLLALLLLSIFVAVFLLTAVAGRVWCGWACPQTVYMEFLYRPIERLFEGRRYDTDGRADVHPIRLIAKQAVFLLISMFLAHTFLAYFVGIETLVRWVGSSPLEHPKAFLVMASVTGLMMLDFAFQREQVCILMCPYGRLQSVLLDRKSLIVSYDPKRGEPRGKGSKKHRESLGDCVDCDFCVTTCPTGIDIRDGLQMECVNCTQCIDACNSIMDRVGKPRGLIRLTSQQAIEDGTRGWLRPRVIIYPLVLLATVTLLIVSLVNRPEFDITLLRTRNTTYQVHGQNVTNIVELKIQNRTEQAQSYTIGTPGESTLASPDLPLSLAGGESGSITLHVTSDLGTFDGGRASLTLSVVDSAGVNREVSTLVLGPLYRPTPAETESP